MADPISGRAEPPFRRAGAATLYGSVLSVSADGSHAAHLLTTSIDLLRRGIAALVVYDLATKAPVLGRLLATAVPWSGRSADQPRRHAPPPGDVATWDVRRLIGGAEGLASLSKSLRPNTWQRRPRRLRSWGPSTWIHGRHPARGVGTDLRVRRTWRVPPLTTNHRIVVVYACYRLVAGGGDHGQLAVDLRRDRVLLDSGNKRLRRVWMPHAGGVGQAGDELCGTDTGQVVMRDVDTGEREGRQLEPLLGEIGALVVTHRGGVLLAFGAEQPDFARWRLDGPGVGGSLLVPGRGGHGRFRRDRPNVRSSATAEWGRARSSTPTLVTACCASVCRVRRSGCRPTRSGCWVSGSSSSTSRPARCAPRSWWARPKPSTSNQAGPTAWAVSWDADHYKLRRVSLSTGQVSTSIRVERAQAVRLVSDGASLFVTKKGPDGDWTTTRYDLTSGAVLDHGLGGKSRVAIAPDHSFMTSDETGVLRAYRDFVFKATAAYPPVGGAGTSIQLSATESAARHGSRPRRRSCTTWRAWSRIGVPIQTQGVAGSVHAWLRPDGQALVTDSSDGVVQWNLDPDAMVEATCELAGRNWTPIEWSTYVGDAAY